MKTLIIIFLIYLLCKKKDVLGGIIRGLTRACAVIGFVFGGIWKSIWMFWCKVGMEYRCTTKPDDAEETRKVWASWHLYHTNYKKWCKGLHDDDDYKAQELRRIEARTFDHRAWVNFYDGTEPTEAAYIATVLTLVLAAIFIPVIIFA